MYRAGLLKLVLLVGYTILTVCGQSSWVVRPSSSYTVAPDDILIVEATIGGTDFGAPPIYTQQSPEYKLISDGDCIECALVSNASLREYNLQIDPIKDIHNGTWRCDQFSATPQYIYFDIIVQDLVTKAKLIHIVNNITVDDNGIIDGKLGEEYEIKCAAFIVNPVTTFEWQVDGEPRIGDAQDPVDNGDGTYNASSTLPFTHNVAGSKVIIQCTAAQTDISEASISFIFKFDDLGSKFPWWGILIIVLVCVTIILGSIYAIYRYKKRQRSLVNGHRANANDTRKPSQEM